MMPVYAGAIRRPVFPTDDHPWVRCYGLGAAVCDHCGAGLSRVVVLDTSEKAWGVDCWRRATGQAAPRKDVEPLAAPILQRITRVGVTIWADGTSRTFSHDGVPEDLVAILSADDRSRLSKFLWRQIPQSEQEA